jgi:glycosyltransferase involved in cell wall biosynthesis
LPDPNTKPSVSIVIPVHNEEAIFRAAIVDLIDRLGVFPWSYELLIAENGSTDRTIEVTEELAARFPQIVCRQSDEPNYGKALRDGILHARGEIVICDEIDLCDTDFYERALAVLQDPSVDFVVGSKVMEGARDERPLYRRLGTVVINGMLRLTLGFKGTDTHGLKAARREPAQRIAHACLIDRDLFASELIIRAERAGLGVREIPVRVLEKRPPTFGLARRIPNVVKSLVKLFIAIRIKG